MDFIKGDWRFFWPESLSSFASFPSSWDSSLNTGVGIQAINTMWITSYLNFTAFIASIGLGWFLTSLLFWIIPIFVISFVSSHLLFRKLFGKEGSLSIISGILYSTNTYFLLIFFGGQLGVAFAYSLVPLVIKCFIDVTNKTSFRNIVLAGLALSAQVLFDPRLTLLTIPILILYVEIFGKITPKYLLKTIAVPLIIVLLLHFYWILPLMLFPSFNLWNQLENSSVSFFSFAFLENSISLLHPNWPENIFGKVSFMKFEYLVIPLLAFLPLAWMPKKLSKNTKKIAFFGIVALCGIFLSKGTNEPFGFIYEILYDHVPGFSAYRDPTKFYSLIALSYSVLIPLSFYGISSFLKKAKRINLKTTHFIAVFLVVWIILLRQIFTGAANVPSINKVPDDYHRLYRFLSSQDQSFRTLWIPQWQRYGYFSTKHPAIGRGELKTDLTNQDNTLDLLSVKYVVVPFDTEGEIFTDDRKYSEKKYQETVEKISKINYLQKVKEFGKIILFENKNFKKRLYLNNQNNDEVKFEIINQTYYKILLPKTTKSKNLIFSESYSPYWKVWIGDKSISSANFKNLNSFEIPQDTYEVELRFETQKYVVLGMIVSLLSLTILVVFVITTRGKKKYDKAN